jgi:Uma2 family endonuclease
MAIMVDGEVEIPARVSELDSFSHWTSSPDYPERGQLSYLGGLLWVDLSMEELYGHNLLKGEITSVLSSLAKKDRKGRFLPDGMWMKNEDADLSTEPDGKFVTYEAFRTGRVKRIKSPTGILFQLDGAPEMTLEIVSATSVLKDTKHLRKLYWKAGVLEYWLVDVRGGKMQFHIFKHGPKGYTTTAREAGGWVGSEIFDRSFRLTRAKDPLGDPEFTLEVRP